MTVGPSGKPMKFVDVVFNTPLQSAYTYALQEDMDCRTGQRVIVMFGRRRITGFVVGERDEVESTLQIKQVLRVVDSEPLFGDPEIALADWIASMYHCSLGEALTAMIPGGRRDSSMPAFPHDEESPRGDLRLTAAQNQAIEHIAGSSTGFHYLFGVTGSGKTEVFLQCAERVIAAGRAVIYLVPEITLTHQLAEEVSRRFEGRVAILHSALTPSQRLAEWMKIRRGEVSIAIGERSAVFAPFTDIGLVIIDEEHENSYKSGSVPRYHARQVAMKRAAADGAALVMGSATPSLEAWHLMQQGRITRLVLPERVSGGKLPEIEVVDITGEEHAISSRLEAEMRRVLERGRQVILFLNRRGFSYFFHCRSCGYEMQCEHCSVSMTFHKARNVMVCHYCGHHRRPVSVCPECGSLDVGYSGFGTELVEAEVAGLFPGKRIARLDTDSARKKDAVRDTLQRFRSGDLDILLGTQMVAKGLNFPGVDLVGVVSADSALHLPDFRAQERTFGLIMQVAGRSGRFSNNGRVVVQTYRPENRAVRLSSVGDIDRFYREELEIRKMTRFPPFTRLGRFVFRSTALGAVKQQAASAADLLHDIIAAVCDDSVWVELLGPVECPIARISGKWRWQLILRSESLTVLHRIMALFHRQFSSAYNVYVELDIDPVSML